ncbi:protein tyrosine phosphatase 61F isoform X2 [Dermatophagoides farinae]|uniref:protein tyrosine phosphatase 61F isoform X2 n=1 Tax=Dermatophagoides farinae TaxID=6954 RepID=UPI003F6155D2
MEAEFHDYENNEKWRKIFKNMNSMSQIFSSKESRKIENKPLNRYTDVVPYDKTRVKLERYNFNYINASHVAVPLANRRYILTQGPLPNTSGHFWLMVWEQKSRAILMLNNLIECGNIKCHKYWPDGQNRNDVDELFFDDVGLKVKVKSVEKFNFYILRTFILSDLLTETSKEILHFHYTSWPDFDLPRSCDSFLEFLSAVRQSGCLDNIDEQHGPPVIHCSAGIGRSGTFVLVDSCLVMIEKNKCRDSINIIDVLLDIRTYRMGLIQTSDQLRFSFMAIIEGSKQMINNDEMKHPIPQQQQQKQQPTNNIKTNTSSNVKIKRSFGIVDDNEDYSANIDDTNIVFNHDTILSDNNVINDSSDDQDDDDYEELINEEVVDDNDVDDDDNQNAVRTTNSTLPNNELSSKIDNTNDKNHNDIDDDETHDDGLLIRQRKKEREEKRRKTMETIQRIKRKQKEMEERKNSGSSSSPVMKKIRRSI